VRQVGAFPQQVGSFSQLHKLHTLPPQSTKCAGHLSGHRQPFFAVYAHLYGLARDELAYILDTFPIVRRKDEEKYGEYRAKRMVLEALESLKPLIE